MAKRKQDVITQLLDDAPHFQYTPGRCLVAPSPELQERIKERFQEVLDATGAEDAVTTGRKGGAKKGKRKAAKGDDIDALVASMLRLRHNTAVGLNDGLIIPGEYFPLGTPVRVVRDAALNRAPLSGTVRVVVILVNFSNKNMTAAHNKKHFEDLFFSTGVLPNGSVKEYFKEVTNGKINIEGEVAGPFKLSNTMAFYANGDSGTGNSLPNARTMAQEAAQLSNPTVNFAPYDNDGNGFVDAFIVIHAGSGAEVTGSVNDIWSHKWVLPSQFNADGTKIFGYLTVPEDSKIGVCCHELGHLLFGFPDLYDTDGTSEGIGNWCLMAGGSWNGGGDIPAHPSAWCKVNQGWASVIVQSNNANVTIPDVKTSKSVYRLWKNGTGGNEYFLVENRQRTKYDQKLPGDGLLIWHIDESVAENSNEAHPKVKLMQADGLNQLESGANRGDAGDPYPGSANKTSFSNTSTPNSKSYAGVNTCVAVTNIGASGPSMTARLSVRCAVIKAKETFKDTSFDKTAVSEKLVHDKTLIKEIEGKATVKDIEKPVTDKSTGLEKPFDKPGEKLGEGGFGSGLTQGGRAAQGGQPGYTGSPEPFISGDMRPDLSSGALLNEEDINEMQAQMQIGSAETKRYFDSKPPEV
jgi:immune inhibitor A